VEKHLTYGQSFCLRQPVFCTFGPPEDAKGRKFGDFLPFQNWQRTCNNTAYQDIVRDSAGRIGLIPRAESIAAACPFLWGRRRTYVSFVRTIYGGTCCYCCYSAARSFCCVSLSQKLFHSLRTWFPHPQALRGKIELEVRRSPGLFPFKSAACRLGVPPPPEGIL
jgi:hypothetical protein